MEKTTMKKCTRAFSFAGILSVAALGSQLAFADVTAPAPVQGTVQGEVQVQHGHFGRHFRKHQFRRLAKALDLSGQQKAEAKALFKANRQENRQLLINMLTAKHQLQAIIASGTADTTTVQAQTALVVAAGTNLAVQKAQNTKQFLALLTPDQVAKYNAIQAKRESRFQHRIARLNGSPATN